jgi:hypothetical protein
VFGRGARTIIVTLNDGTEITIRRKKTGFYVNKEENDGEDDGDGNNDSSSNTAPPGNINHPPTPI